MWAVIWGDSGLRSLPSLWESWDEGAAPQGLQGVRGLWMGARWGRAPTAWNEHLSETHPAGRSARVPRLGGRSPAVCEPRGWDVGGILPRGWPGAPGLG